MRRILLRSRLAILLIGIVPAGVPVTAQEQEQEQEDPRAAAQSVPTTASVSGRLALRSSGPPPDTARVEVICGDQLLGQGYSDSKGHFRVDMATHAGGSVGLPGADSRAGQMSGAPSDIASADRFRSCEVQISFLGARPMRFAVNDTICGFGVDIGTVIVGEGLNQSQFMSATSYAAPKKARKTFAKGTADLLRGRVERAEQSFRESVALYPQYATAWYGLGIAVAHRGAIAEACEAYRHAITADRGYAPPYSPLIRAQADMDQWGEVAALAERLQDLVGGEEAFFYGAMALWRMGRILEAAETLDLGRRATPGTYHPVMLLLGADIHAAVQRWPQAAKDYRAYLALAPGSPAQLDIEKTLDNWEKSGLLPPKLAEADTGVH